MAARVALALLLPAALLALVLPVARAAGDSGIFNPSGDPLGDEDVYAAVVADDNHPDWKGKWTQDAGLSLDDRLNALHSTSIVTHVDVMLVGFSGDGNHGLSVSTASLLSYLEAALVENTQLHVQKPRPGVPNELPMKHRFFFRVHKAKPKLCREITKALHRHVLQGASAPRSSVPIELVDDLVRKDYESGQSSSYTVYLLNPKAASVERPRVVNNQTTDETEKDLFTYWYLPPADARGAGQPKDDDRPCPTTLWAGRDSRYMWIDFTAGPISYGPLTSGNGLVSDFTIPNLENFKVEDESDDEVQVHEEEFVAEAVSVVVKTCNSLIQPSIRFFPRDYSPQVRIHVIELVVSPEKNPKSQFDSSLISAVKDDLELSGQSVIVQHNTLPLAKCHLCEAALISATKSRTSTVFKTGLRTTIHDYVDAAELHERINEFLVRKLNLAEDLGLTDFVEPSDSEVRVIPVFVFDLGASNLVLLDRFHQAVAFHDMVLAVQTGSGPVSVDFTCSDNSLAIDSRDASRAVLGAVLETGWGVDAPYRFYNPVSGREDFDFLWAMGYLPWGPFSRSQHVSFAQKDAAMRNTLYSTIFQSVDHLGDMLAAFKKYEKGMNEVLLPAEHDIFIRRFNIFNYKLEKAAMYMSLLDFPTAFYYARTLRHDVAALANVFVRGKNYVHSHMACAKDAEASLGRDAVVLACLCAIAWVILKMFQIFRQRSKKRRMGYSR